MRILFCGGGTAGHISPAIAIAEDMLSRYGECEILFVGREGGEENEAIKKAGFRLKTVEIYGIQRKATPKNLKRLFIAVRAVGKAKRIIKDFSPDVVIGTGGYVCYPVLRAAKKLKIPTAIHESNACPGLTTKLLAPKCDRVFLALSGAEDGFKDKKNIRIVGNPVRSDFKSIDRKQARRKLGISEKEFLIVSFGGSGGSAKMNEALLMLMERHSSRNTGSKHIHATGKKYYEETKNVREKYTEAKNGCEIKPYIDDMPTLMAAADLVISRSGAMTIAELSAAGCASILIPSPNVTNDHQYKNARLLSECGAALLLSEENLSNASLLSLVEELENNPRKRSEMREKIKQFHHKNSKELIALEIEKIVK